MRIRERKAEKIMQLVFSLWLGGCHVALDSASVPLYTTVNGVSVYSDRYDVATEDVVSAWVTKSLKIWTERMPQWSTCLNSVHEAVDVDVMFEKVCPIYCTCGPDGTIIAANAYTTVTGLSIVIADCGVDEAAFLHELGHIVAWKCGGMWNESHLFFKTIKFPY